MVSLLKKPGKIILLILGIYFIYLKYGLNSYGLGYFVCMCNILYNYYNPYY